MGKLYTSSHPDIIADYGCDPIPTIYKDSNGRTIYITDGVIPDVGQLPEIQLTDGMQSKGVLIFKTFLEENELS